MNLETKCPHCDQWTASNVESCSKCGALLFDSKQGANPLISSLKDNWKLATGLAGAVLIFTIFFRPNPTPPSEKQAQNLPPEKPKQQKPDLSGQLGFYGQWDKDKDGYLNGTEIAVAMTEMNKVEVHSLRDINGESHLIKFRWEPPRDINLDQRLSREELTHHGVGYHVFQKYDLDKDGLLSKAEIEKEPVPDINGNRGKQLLFEPLKKFDLNQDGKLALLEIPPYHSYLGSGRTIRGASRPGGRGGRSRPAGPSVLPGALVLNDQLTRFNAETLQDLVDAGLYDSMDDLQATAPPGAVWGINPDTGLVVPIFP